MSDITPQIPENYPKNSSNDNSAEKNDKKEYKTPVIQKNISKLVQLRKASTPRLGNIHILRKHFFINPNNFTIFLRLFLLLYALKFQTVAWKFCQNVMLKKKFSCFDKKETPVFEKHLEVKLSFLLYKCLRNIWMVPKPSTKSKSNFVRWTDSSWYLLLAGNFSEKFVKTQLSIS